MLLRLITVLTCCAVFCPAQGGETEEEHAARKRAAIEAGEVDVKIAGKGEKGDKEVADEALEKLTPEQRLARNVHHGAASYCTFVATPKPARLLPGQSGVIVVTAILKGQAVLPSPAPLEVTSAAQQGLITFGAAAFRPAENGKLHPGYVGRPVYDNWAIFEIPVTMSPQALVGKKQPVAVEMRFDLYDGMSAQPIGRFLDRASTEIEVGLSADPNVVGGYKPPPIDHSSTPGQGSRDANEPPTDAEIGRPKPETRVVAAPVQTVPDRPTPDKVVAEPAPAPTPPAVADEEGSLPVPLLVGGGALLLALVLLLARRK